MLLREPTPPNLPKWRSLADDLRAAAAARVQKLDRMPREQDLFYACGDLPGMPATLLCYFNLRLLLVAALKRASTYVENGRVVLCDAEMIAEVKASRTLGFNLGTPALRMYLEKKREVLSAGLHPLIGRKGATATEASTHTAADRVLLAIEERFEREVVVPFAKREPHGYLIALSADDAGPSDAEARLTHELLHARSFHEPRYFEAIEAYWKTDVGSNDKAVFRSVLRGHYDVGNETLMADEFQAYMLMPNPMFPILDPLAHRHAAGLANALRKAGVEAIGSLFAPARSVRGAEAVSFGTTRSV